MARGAEAKLRRRNKRKNETEEVTNMFNVDEDSDTDDSDDSVDDVSKKKKREKSEAESVRIPAKKPQSIKTTPLILLVLMVGTTVLPALIYASDMLGNYAAKHHVFGNIGFRMGLGAVPRKRVLSFYEKHDPSKIETLPSILSTYYGDYPKLIQRLERKYQDYGYFLGWEEDEAPMTLALEQLVATREYFVHQYWNVYAPQPLKTAARNVSYNLSFLGKKGKKIWKKKIWPVLEPFFGVPKGAETQKRKDAKEARARRTATGGTKTRRKSKEFRDDVED